MHIVALNWRDPRGDLDALAEPVVRLLTTRALRAETGASARAWARSLTREHCGRDTLALIERVLAEGRVGALAEKRA